MPRKRMIDPSIWTDEGMAELTPRQQLLYIGLFSNADDDGRLKGSLVAISLMLPTIYAGVDRSEIGADLRDVLRTMRQLSRYEVDDRPYLVFQNFRQWQRIDKPSPSILPEPPTTQDDSPNDRGGLDEESPNDPGVVPPKLKEKKLSEQKGSEEKTDARTRAPVDESQPFALLESLCDVLGQDVSVLSRNEKGKQLATAKRLVEAGMNARDVEMMTLWLKSQSWVTGGIDLFFLERQLGKWQLAGKPTAAPAPSGALRVHQGGKANGEAATPDEWAEWRRKRGIDQPPRYSTDEPDDVIDVKASVR